MCFAECCGAVLKGVHAFKWVHTVLVVRMVASGKAPRVFGVLLPLFAFRRVHVSFAPWAFGLWVGCVHGSYLIDRQIDTHIYKDVGTSDERFEETQ